MKVYLIGGKARNGKDTLANIMKEFYEENGEKAAIMHIGNYIKHFAIDYFGWDGNDDTKPRTLLQHLGTDIIRQKMNKPLFFINRLKEDIEVLKNFFDIVIIADVRLPLEFEEIKKIYPDAIKIHIQRPSLVSELTNTEQKHITETALDDYNDYDFKIINNTIEELKEKSENLIKEVENENK